MRSSSVTPSPNNWCPTAISHFCFECPGCRRTFEVDLAMYQSLLEEGCLFCGAETTRGAFSPA